MDTWKSSARKTTVSSFTNLSLTSRSFTVPLKAINLIYSIHIKAVNLIYLYTGASQVYYLSVPNSLFCSYAQFLFIPFKAHKQFICFKIIYSFRSIKQFGNVTKFLFGQPLGHVKGAPRKDRGHKDRLDSIFPRQNHLFLVWKWQLLLRYFIASSHSSMNFTYPKVFEKAKNLH